METKRKVSIFGLELSLDKKLLIEMVERKIIVDDKILNEVIINYSKELEAQGIETFSIDRNIIATENGYKLAAYED